MLISDQTTKSVVLGIFLLLIGLSILYFSDKNRIPNVSSSFENEPVRVEGFENSDYEENSLPKRIIIPGASIDIEVKPSEIVRGYWEVFENVAGWGVGSSVPGEEGNQVIFAHAREGLFASLEEVDEGDAIYLHTKDEWYEYNVYKIFEVYPSNTDVISNGEEEVLTLYTCSGFSDNKRLIVKAKPAGTSKIDVTEDPH